ncbi:helix-turn-helix transcriptional regulator [Microbacteriaceae bacterium VKM Ac-2854]|nr:helix-turn-helix transcriptional regulator [Microbacteriaceae bacterium VKM Ac-2854]
MPHPLGDYLKARRELVRPSDVGLSDGPGVRRVPGLRRSEVAALAGISTEYYVKLEQGQEANPTDHVLDALSRALRLDATANSYLHSLARLIRRPSAAPLTPAIERTTWLLDSWPMTPALILDRHNDIFASNALMRALISGYRVGRNALEVLLLDPAMRDLYDDWDGLSRRSIGLLRSRVGLDPDNVRTQELVAGLLQRSERFRELWHRHDIEGMTEGKHPMSHPDVGALSLHYAHLPFAGSADLTIFLYYAEPGTPSERALAELAATAGR